MSVSENSRGREGFRLGLGFRTSFVTVAAVAAVGGAGGGERNEASETGETSELEVVHETVEEEENGSLPTHRRGPPNLFLYAAGFCVVVLMRDVLTREVAGWGIVLGRIALYVVEGIVIVLGKLTNILAEPIAMLLSLVSWVIMAVSDVYQLIVDEAPVRSLLQALVLSVAVLSIGDATSCKVRGSRSSLVGVATAIGLAGVLEYIPPEAVLLCMFLLTAFAKLIQRADLITVFMPATVTFVAMSEPILCAAALGTFLTVSVFANWRFRVQNATAVSEDLGEATTPSEVRDRETKVGMRDSFVLLAISASICISWAAKILYLFSVKWILLRSVQ